MYTEGGKEEGGLNIKNIGAQRVDDALAGCARSKNPQGDKGRWSKKRQWEKGEAGKLRGRKKGSCRHLPEGTRNRKGDFV